MQPLSWYVRRLRGMSAEEIAWRARGTARDVLDRCRFALGWQPSPPRRVAAQKEPGFRVSDLRVGEWADLPDGLEEARWRDRLLAQADRMVAQRLSFFDLEDCHLGVPIDWNRDHKSGRRAPMGFAPWIDYRNRAVTGDAKFVWEPNRHHHLVLLGRAYRASGETRYATAVVERLDSWFAQCPFGRGMNWRSPLELAIRLINWVWALDLIRESGLVAGDFQERLLRAVYQHLWEITRKYSRGSSANNHLVGEAGGVFVASSYFPGLDRGGRWCEESHAILSREILEQTYADGGGREQAFGYHLFVLEFFLVAGLVAMASGRDFPRVYWERLERMLEFAGVLSEGGDALPMFGDADDGRVLDLGSVPADPRGLLAVGAVLFGRSDFKAWSGAYVEPARWLLGRDGCQRFDKIWTPPPGARLVSRAFPESGYYLLQCGHSGAVDRISVLFDCGELGFKPIAAHGHADALSLSVRAFGVDVLVDPGTFDYFSFPAWRRYFRSTQAHNALVVDDTDQSEMQGPFLWGERARVRCLRWEPWGEGGLVAGEHDGYTRLPDPVVHRRTVELDAAARSLVIRDELLAQGRHRVALYFHLSEACRISPAGPNQYQIDAGPGRLVLHTDPALAVGTLHASEGPIGGWVSHGYHRKVPATTLVARAETRGTASFTCLIVFGRPEHRAHGS